MSKGIVMDIINKISERKRISVLCKLILESTKYGTIAVISTQTTPIMYILSPGKSLKFLPFNPGIFQT